MNNIGHFRFVECSRLVNERPDGDVTPYDPVLFPFDPALYDREGLGRQPVGGWSDGPDVEERYVVAPGGAVEVTLTTQPAGFKRTFRLERCAVASLSETDWWADSNAGRGRVHVLIPGLTCSNMRW